MLIKLVRLETAIAFDTEKHTFHAVFDEQIGPLPDATQTIDLDPLKAVGLIAGGLKKDVAGLLGPKTSG